ncbi:hypothetical protein TWF281_008573 [Arthrobotrys megalospora]
MPYNWDLDPGTTEASRKHENLSASNHDLPPPGTAVWNGVKNGSVEGEIMNTCCPTCGKSYAQKASLAQLRIETGDDSDSQGPEANIFDSLAYREDAIGTPLSSVSPREHIPVLPDVIDLTMDDETDLDHNRETRKTWYARSGYCRWNDLEKTDVYLLKLLYDASSEDMARILTPCHKKKRKERAVKAQFDEHRYRQSNATLFGEVEAAIAGNDLRRYSSAIRQLKRAARELRIELRLKDGVTDPTEAPALMTTSHKSRSQLQGYINNDSSVNESDPSDEDAEGEMALHRNGDRNWVNIHGTTKKLDPSILFRVYDDSSHGKNGPDGFRAGKFLRKSAPILTDCEVVYFDVVLARHIGQQKINGGSTFISTTPSLLWALHKATRIGGNPRISVIDRSKIFQPVQHISTIHPRLKATGLLNNIKYSGKLEYAVYGDIDASAIIHDFSFEGFKRLANFDRQLQRFICPGVLFDNTIGGSLSKLELIRETRIHAWSCPLVVNLISQFVFGDDIDHPLQEKFKANIRID